MSATEQPEATNTSYLAARVLNLQFVLAERERELLELKGPCSFKDCNLHRAHSGPCNVEGPDV
jgi:hypothetical protein